MTHLATLLLDEALFVDLGHTLRGGTEDGQGGHVANRSVTEGSHHNRLLPRSRRLEDALVGEQLDRQQVGLFGGVQTQAFRDPGSQRDVGRRYLVGDALSPLDIWWASFAAMIEPLPPELCPMRPDTRVAYRVRDPVVREATDPALLEHRDFIYREHLELPVRL